MKTAIKEILRDRNGTMSMKRLMGAFTVINAVILSYIKCFCGCDIEISLILGILALGKALLISTIKEQQNVKANEENLEKG